jgi:hypothetical protein
MMNGILINVLSQMRLLEVLAKNDLSLYHGGLVLKEAIGI